MHVFLILDIGGGELLVILLFVLLFFGSKGVPDVARTMGRAMRQFRDASAEVQREIEKGATEMKKGFEEQRKAFRIEPPEHANPQRTTGGTDPMEAPGTKAEEQEAARSEAVDGK
ncbi:MAG TPA: twin-arginine translocase TatA/TatE family subunit [Flavobacteriales bacterium]|nr:twin-arginine translocase TatA/TatE family subunit [Flavobacteriales bacterium]